ncbi:hypothetical protein E2562_001463 [Oryza meyeriana var. granulata]|uniref:mitogen-activated protein kinase kinase n=1 Tax=Oryza meyeriana var. granulata TaxID=110450 RepID=A0A6G1DCR7_9ORYZ|nr:hypothetical protein E2562_001463 [Oryza meyeriana var. granulata]
MALTIRERRLPQLHISLDLPSCAGAFRYPNPPVAAPASTSAAAARAGEFRVSDFDRVAVLGRGNGGAVYKVAHRRTSAVYALKVLHGGDPGAAAAEADVLRRADSPHVVRCHSILPAATSSGDVALLLELVDGGSLASVMARAGAFPEAALAEVAAQALSGLACLHARRVVHRDIKPANLLVSTVGEVKIADFGIAKVLSRAGDHCTAYEGTAAYMSPERFDSERHADPFAADVWSLGVTILELLMGRYPLLPAGQKPTWAALMCAICFGELPSLPDDVASPDLRAFLAACLHKDYTKRASVAQLLAHRFVAGRGVAASKLALRRLVAGA